LLIRKILKIYSRIRTFSATVFVCIGSAAVLYARSAPRTIPEYKYRALWNGSPGIVFLERQRLFFSMKSYPFWDQMAHSRHLADTDRSSFNAGDV
jgi:hypothetical protein